MNFNHSNPKDGTAILILLFFLLSFGTIYSQVPESERNALIAFYDATNGDNWIVNTNWKSNEPVDDWFGVGTTFVQGVEHVSYIWLHDNNLVGQFPPEIGAFPFLTQMYIYSNEGLTGSIPPEMGNLTNLAYLNLWKNNLSGELPPELSNCHYMRDFAVDENNLTGTIPESYSDWENTGFFWVNNNLLTGEVPDFFWQWEDLTELSLGRSDISGNHNTFYGNLDLSSNFHLYKFFIANNDFEFVSMGNWNNNLITDSNFDALNNPHLHCIAVYDVQYSTTNWTRVDPTTTFVYTLSECEELDVPANDDLTGQLKVFPNPATNQLSVDCTESIHKISMINSFGVVVLETDQTTFSISHLPAGIYYIKMETREQRVKSNKVIIR